MGSKTFFENFYGKVFGTSVWDIVTRNGKSTLFKNTIRNCYYSYHKNLQNLISLDYGGDNVDKGYDCLRDLFFGCEEALILFRLGFSGSVTHILQ